TMEGEEVGAAFASTTDPNALQQRLMELAMQFNDPQMYRDAAAGNFANIERVQARRDMYNQPLQKLNEQHQKAADEHQRAVDAHEKAVEEQQDRASIEQEVNDAERDYVAEHPDATPADRRRVRNDARADAEGRRTRGTGAKAPTVEQQNER